MADPLLAAVQSGYRSYDLSRPYRVGMPQSPTHPPYQHFLPLRHGDVALDNGGSAANDLIVMGTHVGTHMDALVHISKDGQLHGGLDASAEQRGGRFPHHGIDTVAVGLVRGVLFDVPATLGKARCDDAYEITPQDLERTAERQQIELAPGDIPLVRSGWGSRWHEGPTTYVGRDSGVPGVSEAGARWFAERGPRAVGADTIAFEQLPPGKGHANMAAHSVLLVEYGINIIETLNLEELAADGVYEFTLVVAPLPLVGATGSPVRPLALVADAKT